MNEPSTPPPESEFERIYRLFIERGGFAQPCVTEDAERFHMQKTPYKPERCRHGLTRQTCSECNFSGFQKETEG